MAAIGGLFFGFSKLFTRGFASTKLPIVTEGPLKGMDPDKWMDCRMKRDVKRRRCVKEHATMRVRLISMKRNDILPVEIREDASLEMEKIPRQSALRQLTQRCVVTSRPRGVVYRWRLSRMVFRHEADYNKMAGVQRARW